jgi:hypothetical protein
MRSLSIRQLGVFCALVLLCAGCGTTRRTDTTRTATEQLLLSDAIDRSISKIDFALFAGKEVYLDNTYVSSVVDKDYITSTLRQRMLACGCILKDKKDDAALVVEVRAGAVGTDRHDLLFGTPATSVSLGALSPVPGTPTQVPEIALAKRTDQMGVAKIAVFAYERASGIPIWQSGSDVVASRSRDLWVFGTGPFQRGNIYGGTKFAGEDLRVPLVSSRKNDERPPVAVARERVLNPQALSRLDEEERQASTDRVAATPAKAAATPVNGANSAAPVESPGRNNDNPRPLESATQGPSAGEIAEAAGHTAGPPRSQFDAAWSPTPLPSNTHDAQHSTADRRWPPTGQTQ